MAYKLIDLIQGLENVSIKGDPNCWIEGVNTIQNAQSGDIVFLTNSLYRKYLTNTKATAVILSDADAELCPVNAVISKNPHFTYAKIASFFEKSHSSEKGIHISAVIGNDCDIDPSANIGANCVIGNRVKIARHVLIGPGTIISDEVEIDEGSHI